MTEFIMVRHGEPDYEVVNGWAGIAVAKNFAPLTEKGVCQIQETIEILKQENAAVIISSPFTRCMQGACMMSKELQLDVIVENDLYEWQLDKTHSVRSKVREKILIWKFNHTKWNRFSKWENPNDVKKRVLQVFNKYLDYEKVIVSCHAMMIMYTLGDEKPTEYGKIRRIKYDGTSLAEVELC